MKVLFAANAARLDGGAAQSLLELVSALAGDDRFEPVVSVPRPGALTDALDARSIPWLVVATPAWTAYTDPERTLGHGRGGADPRPSARRRRPADPGLGRAAAARTAGGRRHQHRHDPGARARLPAGANPARLVAPRDDEPAVRGLVRAG